MLPQAEGLKLLPAAPEHVQVDEGLGALIALQPGGVGVLPKEWDYKGHEMYSAFFYPHGLSHHIGCNVHDQCYHPDVKNFGYDYAYSSVMKPGMVISIEPGIYFHAERLRKESESLKGVNMELAMRFARTVGGIRIEDDLLVTETGCRIIGDRTIPITVEQLEAVVGR